VSDLVNVELQEWQTATPASHSQLRGLSFDNTPGAQALAGRLAKHQRLVISERRDGLTIETNSFVGAITVGPVRISIGPKLQGSTMLRLLRYAYGLRNLDLHSEQKGAVAQACFQDLLLYQLAAEVGELLARGLHRRYLEQRDQLAMPRGRIDFPRLASAGLATAELPCRYFSRDENCFPNQVLLAGVRLGATIATDSMLALRLRQLERRLDDGVQSIRLDEAVFARVIREQNRLLAAYEPAFELIRLLVNDMGAAADGEETAELPGFLFDMNRFFERLIERFLTEQLPDCKVTSQHTLRRLFSYDINHNPCGRRPPRPRPDLVISGAGQTVVLDAKYRDLWVHTLPREMLYQLAVYTLGGVGGRTATILHPTLALGAREQWVLIRDPVAGATTGKVVIRPVPVEQLASLLADPPTSLVQKRRRALALQLAFGTPEPTA